MGSLLEYVTVTDPALNIPLTIGINSLFCQLQGNAHPPKMAVAFPMKSKINSGKHTMITTNYRELKYNSFVCKENYSEIFFYFVMKWMTRNSMFFFFFFCYYHVKTDKRHIIPETHPKKNGNSYQNYSALLFYSYYLILLFNSSWYRSLYTPISHGPICYGTKCWRLNWSAFEGKMGFRIGWYWKGIMGKTDNVSFVTIMLLTVLTIPVLEKRYDSICS